MRTRLSDFSFWLRSFYIFCLTLLCLDGFSQETSESGYPLINNYSYLDYNADPVSWWIMEDARGIMYFANNQGLLEFDGANWRLIPNSNAGARNHVTGDDGVIYMGMEGDLGYLGTDQNGELSYISMKDSIPERYRVFETVWMCYKTSEGIWFLTNNKLFLWDYKKFSILESEDGFHVGAVINDRFYVRIWNKGLHIVENGELTLVPNGQQFADERIYVFLFFDEERILVGTRNLGLFLYDGIRFEPFKTEVDDLIKSSTLYLPGTVLSDGNIALNTLNSGLLIINKQGKLIRQFSTSTGLQDNAAHFVYEDSKKNIWLALTNGISKINYTSPLSYYSIESGLPTKEVYSTIRYKGSLYAGTQHGAFYLDPNSQRFRKVTGSDGQTFGLLEIGDELLAGSLDNGVFLIKNNQFISVRPSVNYDYRAQFLHRSVIDSTLVYVQIEHGISTLRLDPDKQGPGRWTEESFREGLASFSFEQTKDGAIWLDGDRKGEVKRITPKYIGSRLSLPDSDITVFGTDHGLPDKNMFSFRFFDQIYFTNPEKDEFYVFDENDQNFIRERNLPFSNYVGPRAGTSQPVIDGKDHFWADYGGGAFVAVHEGNGEYRFINSLFKEFQYFRNNSIFSEIDQNGNYIVWFAGAEGIIRYEGNLDEEYSTEFPALIRSITIGNDSAIYHGNGTVPENSRIPFSLNTLKFNYSSPFFISESDIEFQTYLEGFDSEWSVWRDQNEKEYTNLPPGHYTFRVKAKNIYDQLSQEASFAFTIARPWYSTIWAYILYILAGLGLVYLFVRWRLSQLKQHSLELEKEVQVRTKEIQQRVEELSVINSVQEALVEKLDLNAIYTMVGEKIKDVFDAQVVVINTYDRENNLTLYRYAYEKGQVYNLDPKPIDPLRKKIMESSKPLLINHDFSKTLMSMGVHVATAGEPPKSALWVPLATGDKVIGSVSLQNVDHEYAFSDNDVKVLSTLTNSMAVALENARLFEETSLLLDQVQSRARELSVINSVQEGLVEKMELDSIYSMVGSKIKNTFDAQAVVINIFDHKKNLTHYKFIYEKGEVLHADPRPIDKLRQKMIDDGIYILFNENCAEELQALDVPISTVGEAPKSALWVPLIIGEKVTGSISLQNVDHENAFSENDVKLLMTLTNSMAVALENARLFEETNLLLEQVQSRARELSVINSVQKGLVEKMELDSIYSLVGEKIKDTFDAQAVVINIFDHKKDLTHYKYVYEKGKVLHAESRPIDNLRKKLISDNKYILINENFAGKLNSMGVPVSTVGDVPKSALYVPLLLHEKVTGCISLQNVDHENAFSEDDVRLLMTLTNSMAVALENARLFEESKILLKEVQEQKKELELINSIQQGLVEQIETEGIYTLVGDKIRDRFNAQVVVINTFDEKNQTTNYPYSFEKGKRYTIADAKPLNNIFKKIIETKSPILINENYAEWREEMGLGNAVVGEIPKSALWVPVILREKVIGSVSLQNVDEENVFSKEDVDLLSTLSNTMSVALQNTKLFEETRQRANEMSTVNSISQALTSNLELDTLFKMIGDRMQELFLADIVYIAMHNRNTNIIHFPYQYGDDLAPLEFGEGLTSQIILKKKSILRNKDVRKMHGELGIEHHGVEAASYLGVPIFSGDDVLGVISVQSTKERNRFSETDMYLMETIAANVGIAIHNAQLFAEAEKARAEAEDANEAKSSFLSTVSHELRTPLTSVLGFAKIIRKRLEEKVFPSLDAGDKKMDRTVRQISDNLNVVVSEGQRLTKLINEVLDLAKIESGNIEWHMEELQINDIIERAISATDALLGEKPLKLKRNLPTGLPVIIGDEDKLIQVVVNLLSNAVKFTDKGSIECSAGLEKGEILVSVKDSGIGIANHDLPKVFEKFKQVGDTLTDKPKGTGLGLPISKEIISHHGGRLWVESEPGKGSTFFFTLPVDKQLKIPLRTFKLDDLIEQIEEKFSGIESGAPAVSGKTILVADDEAHIQELLKQELTGAGFKVKIAGNGKEALELIRKTDMDLVILDVKMPEMNGFDVAAILKNDPKTRNIPIIILSIVEDKKRGYGIGIDRYLTKPIDMDKLFQAINSLLGQGKSKRKVMVVDEDLSTVNTLMNVLEQKGYQAVEANGKELIEKAIASKPDIIILKSTLEKNQEKVKSLRLEKGLENVLFLVYE